MVAGSDAPMLGGESLAAAVAGMGRDGVDVLLAPCDDGGYALVALTRRAPALFTSMAWSAPTVLAETRARAAAAGLRVRELATGYDVDEPADVQRLAEELAAAPARARALTPNTARVLARHEQAAEVAAASTASNAGDAENAASSARRPRHTPQA